MEHCARNPRQGTNRTLFGEGQAHVRNIRIANGIGCSNLMQLAQGHNLSTDFPCNINLYRYASPVNALG